VTKDKNIFCKKLFQLTDESNFPEQSEKVYVPTLLEFHIWSLQHGIGTERLPFDFRLKKLNLYYGSFTTVWEHISKNVLKHMHITSLFLKKLDERAETLCVVLIIVMLLCTQDIINEKALIKAFHVLTRRFDLFLLHVNFFMWWCVCIIHVSVCFFPAHMYMLTPWWWWC